MVERDMEIAFKSVVDNYPFSGEGVKYIIPLAKTNERKRMAGLQWPVEMRPLGKKLNCEGIKGRKALAMLLALRDKEKRAKVTGDNRQTSGAQRPI